MVEQAPWNNAERTNTWLMMWKAQEEYSFLFPSVLTMNFWAVLPLSRSPFSCSVSYFFPPSPEAVTLPHLDVPMEVHALSEWHVYWKRNPSHTQALFTFFPYPTHTNILDISSRSVCIFMFSECIYCPACVNIQTLLIWSNMSLVWGL